jgi:hypothetical protein
LSLLGWLPVGTCGKAERADQSTHAILNLLKLVGNDIKKQNGGSINYQHSCLLRIRM